MQKKTVVLFHNITVFFCYYIFDYIDAAFWGKRDFQHFKILPILNLNFKIKLLTGFLLRMCFFSPLFCLTESFNSCVQLRIG